MSKKRKNIMKRAYHYVGILVDKLDKLLETPEAAFQTSETEFHIALKNFLNRSFASQKLVRTRQKAAL